MKKSFLKIPSLPMLLMHGCFLLFASCSAKRTPTPEELADVKPTFTFKEKKPVYLKEPLGNYRLLDVQWQNPNSSTPVDARYIGWDYNGDNRFDMIEVTEKGSDTAHHYIFDFDGDGKIDLVRTRRDP
jgi:hypothetical protein